MSIDRVSVVIPAYNTAAYLGEALESVVAQTHRPFEVIVVDDGSSDGTGAVARRFPVVKLMTVEHRGVSVARNIGVAASSGNFIAFLDADDYWHSSKLERQLDLAAAEPSAGIVMARQAYRFEGEIPSWFRGPRDGGSEAGYVPSNWLMRRATWDKVGEFKAGMEHAEDTDWLARASDAGIKILMVDSELVVHRIHNANASRLAAPTRTNVLQALRDSVHRKQLAGG